ncbi:MAG: carboxylating nicotinate-nucleotide diphosphorylase [Candidatus Euphemobacter frigidus]|nr:carboxylating nicotinate-nucleotide diphosphorylase [Candidatus Euphemobacter frigidus]MDP8275297.1 carboxylating nicotinate-nucleotide diphosphorylase [Candidatus Euphemobacter frigidus]
MNFEIFHNLVQQALAEDIGGGDLTTTVLIAPDERARAVLVARQRLVVAGLPLAEMTFKELDPELSCQLSVEEGETVAKGTVLMSVEGRARPILTGERTALNFLQHLCGIATYTKRFVHKLKGRKTVVLDTRKTIPGLRKLQKYAVLMGGGENHRFGLYDSILIKDNHLALVAGSGPGKIQRAIRMSRSALPHKEIEIEVETTEELREALEAGADAVLLDNFSPEELTNAVELTRGRTRLEASGGINLRSISTVAASKVESISLGCLTHSAPAADIALELELDHSL